jgi:hypothetical protein
MSAVPRPSPPEVDVRSAASAAAALRTFFRIAERWHLSIDEQRKLLDVGKSRLYEWRKGEVKSGLDNAQIERLSYVFGIYKALEILFPQAERADAWIRKPNSAPLFGGGSALERMLAGNVSDLYVVRQYLDAQRGGWA